MNSNYKIGVDIGGTNIKAALFDGSAVLKNLSVPTNGKLGREAILSSLYTAVDGLFTDGVSLIGVSSAGNINPYNGVCVYATDNLRGWTGLDIKSVISARYGVPVIVDNDAICALKAEMDFYPDSRDLVMITFGTGIGGAVLSGGKIIRGKNFDGGRLGHICLVPSGRNCNCGKSGCAESYLSCTALSERATALCGPGGGCKQLFSLYSEGDGGAIGILKEFSFYLNIFLDNVRTAYAPDYIILGGGLMNDKEIVFDLINHTEDIRVAACGNLAGAIGALKTVY